MRRNLCCRLRRLRLRKMPMRCSACNIKIIAATAATGAINGIGGIIIRATGPITAIIATGARHRAPIAAATRMCAGAITVTGPTAPMTTPTSPITGRGASAIRLICETNKAPDDPGLCFQAAVQSGDVGTDRGCNQANCNGDHHAIDARLVEQNGES
ncbi:hypothetical protein C038_00109 [Brucella sp. 63/311]|nr:hypothetical protein C038_00109 [Brucella sp. 63/311]